MAYKLSCAACVWDDGYHTGKLRLLNDAACSFLVVAVEQDIDTLHGSVLRDPALEANVNRCESCCLTDVFQIRRRRYKRGTPNYQPGRSRHLGDCLDSQVQLLFRIDPTHNTDGQWALCVLG